jgi:hypothetical protein
MNDSIGTDTDPAAHEWAITDRVSQLRMWGTGVVYPLPISGEPTLGSAATCSLRLNHPQVSRQHATLVRRRSGWGVRDLGSKNGILIDGAHRLDGVLEPGTELTVGGVILIAESDQLIALRDFLARLLGWTEARRPDVDRALRSVRMAATHRAPLVLSGQGELALIARSLHARVRGRDKPFILCDPRRRASDGGVRSVANRDEADVALRAAFGGSLCFLRRRLPPGAVEVFSEVRDPKTRVQLIVCELEQEQKEVESFLSAAAIALPSLRERADDVDRIISEYAQDATTELGIVRESFTDEDRAWVRTYSASSLPDIERGTRRLVAVRASRNVSIAAQRLGMAPVSLSRWIERRGRLERDPLVAAMEAASRRGRRSRRHRSAQA